MESQEAHQAPDDQQIKGTDFTEKKDAFARELRKLSCIAMPMIVVSVMQFMVRMVPMMMLGHVSELALSSAGTATSFANVTGYSLMHVYQYASYGVTMISYHQEPAISKEAGKFTIWLIPWLFSYAILQCLCHYLQTQSLILPMLLSSVFSLCIQMPVSWAFIFKLKLGNAGAALSIGLSYWLNVIFLGLSYWLNVIFLGLYVKYSSACEKTRAPFTKDVFLTIRDFLRFAIPSAMMVCLTIGSLHYLIQNSIATAVSTRVSNELGAGKPYAARLAVSAVLILSIAEFSITSSILFICRYKLGYVFSSEKGVVNYIKDMTPFLCASTIMDSLNIVFSGVARGSGWLRIGAYVNLGAYYLIGIPVALLLGFALHLNGKGLWSGLIAGSTTQVTFLSLITYCTNWEKLATKARRRIFGDMRPTDSG